MTPRKNGTLRARVPEEVFSRAMKKAASKAQTQSEYLRSLVLSDLAANESKELPAVVPSTDYKIASSTVRLPDFLKEEAEKRADAKGMGFSRWVAALVQSHLTNEPVLTIQEQHALMYTWRQLGSLLNNINQAARGINAAYEKPDLGHFHALVSELKREMKTIRKQVKALVKSSRQAWAVDDESR